MRPAAPPSGPPCPLDKPVREDPRKVSASAFTYLYIEMIHRLRSKPTPVLNIGEWEERIAKLGAEVGRRTLGLAIAAEGEMGRDTKRDNTNTDDVVKLVATVLWKRWFDRPATKWASEPSDGVHYINDESPLLFPLRPDMEELGSFHYGIFIAGMVKGVLEACGFEAEVMAIYLRGNDPAEQQRTADAMNPGTQYYIQWSKKVLERRYKTA